MAKVSKNLSNARAPQVVDLRVEYIRVPKNGRSVNDGIVRGLADSIDRVGMHNPILVKRLGDHRCRLVSGRHRLAAIKLLGRERIDARIIDDDVAGIAGISENLHRSELSRLERDEAVVEYLKARNGDGGLAAQPHDKGFSRLASQIGLDRKQIRQAVRNAGICKAAKDLLKLNGLDNVAKDLARVSAKHEPADQVAVVQKLISKKPGKPLGRQKQSRGSLDIIELDSAENSMREVPIELDEKSFRKIRSLPRGTPLNIRAVRITQMGTRLAARSVKAAN